MVVPYTPGSPVDVLARLATQHASTRLGQTIVIDNRPGAGTTIGTKAAAAADPDGYTILIAATSFIISSVLYPNPGYDPLKSFAPVSMLARSPQVLVIAPEVPAKTVAGIRRLCEGQPEQAEFRLRARHAAADPRRDLQGGDQEPTSSAFPTRAARRRSPTCSAAAST